jgi:hypothetical protein
MGSAVVAIWSPPYYAHQSDSLTAIQALCPVALQQASIRLSTSRHRPLSETVTWCDAQTSARVTK